MTWSKIQNNFYNENKDILWERFTNRPEKLLKYYEYLLSPNCTEKDKKNLETAQKTLEKLYTEDKLSVYHKAKYYHLNPIESRKGDIKNAAGFYAANLHSDLEQKQKQLHQAGKISLWLEQHQIFEDEISQKKAFHSLNPKIKLKTIDGQLFEFNLRLWAEHLDWFRPHITGKWKNENLKIDYNNAVKIDALLNKMPIKIENFDEAIDLFQAIGPHTSYFVKLRYLESMTHLITAENASQFLDLAFKEKHFPLIKESLSVLLQAIDDFLDLSLDSEKAGLEVHVKDWEEDFMKDFFHTFSPYITKLSFKNYAIAKKFRDATETLESFPKIHINPMNIQTIRSEQQALSFLQSSHPQITKVVIKNITDPNSLIALGEHFPNARILEIDLKEDSKSTRNFYNARHKFRKAWKNLSVLICNFREPKKPLFQRIERNAIFLLPEGAKNMIVKDSPGKDTGLAKSLKALSLEEWPLPSQYITHSFPPETNRSSVNAFYCPPTGYDSSLGLGSDSDEFLLHALLEEVKGDPEIVLSHYTGPITDLTLLGYK